MSLDRRAVVPLFERSYAERKSTQSWRWRHEHYWLVVFRVEFVLRYINHKRKGVSSSSRVTDLSFVAGRFTRGTTDRMRPL